MRDVFNWIGTAISAYIAIVLGVAKGDFAVTAIGLLFFILFFRDLLNAS